MIEYVCNACEIKCSIRTIKDVSSMMVHQSVCWLEEERACDWIEVLNQENI